MMQTFLDELSSIAASISDRGRKLFAQPFQWVCLANGDADFQDNLIFFGFDDRGTDPVLTAKVPRLAKNGWMLETEYLHLVDLWNCIGSAASRYVPRPFAFTPIQDRSVLILSYVPGESLTRLSPRTFWAKTDQVKALAYEAARTLRELNQLTERPAQHANTNRELQARIDKFRELFSLNDEENRALFELVETVGGRSKSVSQEVLIQGDFWHGNMICDKRLGTLTFVDWQFARWSTDVSIDVYFFLLAGALSAVQSDSLQERARRAAQLLGSWRNDLIPAYLAAYGQPDHYLLLAQKQGMLLCCVEKATRSALEFGYSHSDDMLWRYLFAELLQWPADQQL